MVRLSSTLMMCQPNWVFTGSEISLAELERHLGEFRHHLVLGEIAEIAALGRARILRLLLGERGEIRAAFELGEHGLGFVFGRNEDVARVHLLLARHLLDGFFVDLAFRFVGQRGLARVLQQRFHQEPVAIEREPPLDIRPVAEFLLLGRLREHDHVDEIGDEIIALLLRRHRRHIGADFLLGEGEVALADIDAVNAGDHRILDRRRAPRPHRGPGERRRRQQCDASTSAPSARADERAKVPGHETILGSDPW